ncbi:hypothetical protein PENVUL_c002G01696 [Penicillium vulpinum]|uniref:non-specific serine/threonine protein kinase n=1 Tax=Penicillium vulpinum TaxID=29845 RepID=A0A1V6SCD5_9EURO|nr:hypothetical protein PENVUL_c002G01696 [Penicillium vulpinum]
MLDVTSCIYKRMNPWRFSRQAYSFLSNQFHVPKTISKSVSQYRLIEDVEDLDSYHPRGYYPLQIGDELNNSRYRVIDKLGYGGYSTIWLARDLQMARYVALKVITADASCFTQEASVMPSVGNVPSGLGRGVIPPLIDKFWVTGPNDKHTCIFTPPARMSLFDAKEASTLGLFQPKVAQSIIAQLIHGVAFLHSEQIVHGGNILLQFPEAIDRFSTSELCEKFGKPEPEAVIRLDRKPLMDGVLEQVFIPGLFGPPEARFSDEPLSFPSDIWTLACAIWEIAGQRPLFEAFFPTADRVTADQVEVLGI